MHAPAKKKRTGKVAIATQIDPRASEAYGELREDLHFTGYAFERGCHRLRKLLSDDSWKQVGGGFTNVDDFLNSLQLDQFAKVTEEKREIAKLIKGLRPEISGRKIAQALKVDEGTLRKNSAAKPEKASENNNGVRKNSAPRIISGSAAGKLVVRREAGAQERLAKMLADEQRVLNLMPIVGKHRTLILDPAWDYEWLSLAGRAKPGYAMQTIESLRALDVRAWADDVEGCHLYCCTTNNFSYEAHKLIDHWGFQHRTVITWIKPPPFGMGSYFRNSTEQVLFATLGKTTTRPAAASIPTHFEAPRGEHSEKPEKFYDIVRAASYPPYGEANQREAREGFINLYCPVTDAPEDYKPEAAE